MSWAEIKKAVNSDISTPLNQFIKGGIYLFDSAGNYEIEIPVDTYILVTAAGGGGGGGGMGRYGSTSKFGGGGGGGAAIRNKAFSVKAGTISITVGAGGAGGSSSGSSGEPTVIGDLITLPGGSGGTVNTSSAGSGSPGGSPGGLGGGAGGSGGYYLNSDTKADGSPGGPGIIGDGGQIYSSAFGTGGAGGGSIGQGGWAIAYTGDNTDYRKPKFGGGGGTLRGDSGYPGASGIVCIAWGVIGFLQLINLDFNTI